MDQCTHCTVWGDFETCETTDCNWHELWYTQQLKADRDRAYDIRDSIERKLLCEVRDLRDIISAAIKRESVTRCTTPKGE